MLWVCLRAFPGIPWTDLATCILARQSRVVLAAGADRRALHVGGPGRAGRFLLQRGAGVDEDGDDAQVPGFLEGFEDESDDDDDDPRVRVSRHATALDDPAVGDCASVTAVPLPFALEFAHVYDPHRTSAARQRVAVRGSQPHRRVCTKADDTAWLRSWHRWRRRRRAAGGGGRCRCTTCCAWWRAAACWTAPCTRTTACWTACASRASCARAAQPPVPPVMLL